jgi:hypothetical protein
MRNRISYREIAIYKIAPENSMHSFTKQYQPASYYVYNICNYFEKINNQFVLFVFLVGWNGIKDIGYCSESEIGLFTWDNYSAGIEIFLNEIE